MNFTYLVNTYYQKYINKIFDLNNKKYYIKSIITKFLLRNLK